MTHQTLDSIADSPAYWTHKVGTFPSPIAQGRMAQLVDFDDRLYEQARIVYRFMIFWYHEAHGDALISMRHVASVMKQRAPAAAAVMSRSAVHRAIIALIETGWVVRSYRGRGRNKDREGSRYIPVANVLDLAAQGKFPKKEDDLSHGNGTDSYLADLSHVYETDEPFLSHSNGTDALLSVPACGTKTHTPDSRTVDARTGGELISSAPLADGLSATAAGDGFGRLAAAYDKRGDDLAKARAAFDTRNPAPAELERMITAAASWKRTARGKRMSLARWIEEVRWLADTDAAGTAPPLAPRWPACVVTRISPRLDDGYFDGAKIWFRDRKGTARMRMLDREEYEQLQAACAPDRPLVNHASEDLHEFVGARFQLDGDFFEPVEAAA